MREELHRPPAHQAQACPRMPESGGGELGPALRRAARARALGGAGGDDGGRGRVMATVNRHSLIQEFDTLKARFEALCAEGTMSPQTRTLFEALLALFAVLMAVWMEKTTPKAAPTQASRPRAPAMTRRRCRAGAKAKGPAHHAGHCANTRTREHVKVLTVERCARCGEDLADTDCLGHQRRTPHRHRLREGGPSRRCTGQALPRCHTETRAPFPPHDARTAPVRQRPQGLRRTPARRPDALAQARRTLGPRPSSHTPSPRPPSSTP